MVAAIRIIAEMAEMTNTTKGLLMSMLPGEFSELPVEPARTACRIAPTQEIRAAIMPAMNHMLMPAFLLKVGEVSGSCVCLADDIAGGVTAVGTRRGGQHLPDADGALLRYGPGIAMALRNGEPVIPRACALLGEHTFDLRADSVARGCVIVIASRSE